MDLLKFGKTLSVLLPKIKTPLQLSGLIVGLAFALSIHFAKPGDNVALITAGSVGMSPLIFGQLFHFLKDFPASDRAKVFLITFLVFCAFTLSLLLLTLGLVARPTVAVSKYTPTPEIEAALHGSMSLPPKTEDTAPPPTSTTSVNAPTGQPSSNTAGGTLSLPKRDLPRNADCTYSEATGVPTLTTRLMYSVNSRLGLYPNADFHDDVSWARPWLSFNIANPSNDLLFYNSLETQAIEINLINELILNVPNIERATPATAKMTIINEGWGKAVRPTLEIRFVKPVGDSYVQLGKNTFTLHDFDEGTTVDLAPLPPLGEWKHSTRFKPTEYCKEDAYLEALGRLHYFNESGKAQVETFRTRILTCITGGGTVGPVAAFNLTLPVEKDKYPLYIDVSDCIASKSADKLVVRLTTTRSAHFKLKFSLIATSGTRVDNIVDVDVLVPRVEYEVMYHDGNFFKAANKQGCVGNLRLLKPEMTWPDSRKTFTPSVSSVTVSN